MESFTFRSFSVSNDATWSLGSKDSLVALKVEVQHVAGVLHDLANADFDEEERHRRRSAVLNSLNRYSFAR